MELILLACAIVMFASIIIGTTSMVVLERPFLSTSWLFGGMALFDLLFNGFNAFKYLFFHPEVLFGVAVSYFIIGIIWSLIRWYLFSLESKRKYVSRLDDFKKHCKIPLTESLPSSKVPQWRQYKREQGIPDIPMPSENKLKIFMWFAYWPFSILHFILADFFTMAFDYSFEKLKSIYASIAKRAFKDVEMY